MICFSILKKRKNMKNKNWFTMIEIVMITIVLGLWILSVVMAVNKIELANIKLAQSVIANNLAAQWIEEIYADKSVLSDNYQQPIFFCLNWNEWQKCSETDKYQYSGYISAKINYGPVTNTNTNNNVIWYDVCSVIKYEANAGWMAKKELENKICAVVDVEH